MSQPRLVYDLVPVTEPSTITPRGCLLRWKLNERVPGIGSKEIWTTNLKKIAVDFARQLCREKHAEGRLVQLVVHKADGEFQFEATYGADPERTAG